MNIVVDDNGRLIVDDARIAFLNFEGRPTPYDNYDPVKDRDREYARTFSLVIDDPEVADKLIELGWNVKISKKEVEEGGIPFMHLPVSVNFGGFKEPNIYLKSCGNTQKLDKETVGILDHLNFTNVSLDINPYHWRDAAEKKGKTIYFDCTSSIKAYLDSMQLTQIVDRFAKDYEDSMAEVF